jgi:hypothetical protein
MAAGPELAYGDNAAIESRLAIGRLQSTDVTPHGKRFVV